MQIALLVAFFAVGGRFGTLNDIAIVMQYLLALPIPIAIHQLIRARAQLLSTVAMLVGIVGILAVALLQLLLIVGILSFAHQFVPINLALFLGVGGWMLLVGYLGHTTHVVRHSIVLGILGWTYLGYPVWAFGMGRQLLSGSRN